uniref:Uncharacterized protein n=1 Tax=Cacopsylla melanoneura TaxID=428564 RepID=A0A8D8ZK60_9HEMI
MHSLLMTRIHREATPSLQLSQPTHRVMKDTTSTRAMHTLQDTVRPPLREATVRMAPQATRLRNPRTEMQELTVSLGNLQGHAIKKTNKTKKKTKKLNKNKKSKQNKISPKLMLKRVKSSENCENRKHLSPFLFS